MSFTNEQIERYSRHIILKEIGVKGQKKLLSSKVLIIGAGGLGAPAAMYLAAAGVGTIGIAETRLPQRASTKQFFKTFDFCYISNDTSGGAYCHLLSGDRPIIGNSHNVIQIYRLDENGVKPKWEIEKEWNIAPHLPKGSFIQDAIPDYEGNIWFVTRFGQVSFVDKSDKVHVTTIKGEEINNTIAISGDGVFINTNFAQYKFGINEEGNPYPVWRTEYDRGTSQKPGSILQGSGTTPTLLDVPRTDGSTARLVAITDHAGDRIHIVIYNRDTGDIISETPLFDHGHSVTENSLIAYDRSFIIENNFAETGSAFLTKNPTGYPGVARVEVNADATDAKLVWESREASPSTVPKLSTKNGLVYLYTREINEDIPKKAVAWYLTAIDYETGETVFKIFTVHIFNGGFSKAKLPPAEQVILLSAQPQTSYQGSLRFL